MPYYCRSFDVGSPGRLALINTDDSRGEQDLEGTLKRRYFLLPFARHTAFVPIIHAFPIF
jgi:hypothetical protein